MVVWWWRVPHRQAISGLVDFEQKLKVRALGGLLEHLRDEVFKAEYDKCVRVARLGSLAGLRGLRLDPIDFRALGIFVEDRHPNLAAGGGSGGSKEGFSLFALLDRTRSRGWVGGWVGG